MKAEKLSCGLTVKPCVRKPDDDHEKAPEVHRISIYAHVLYRHIFPSNQHISKKHHCPKNPCHIINRNVLDFCARQPS
jgi:hypothetical protein